METFMQAFLPLWNAIVPILALAIGGYIAFLYKQKTGVDLDSSARNAIQTAITNAALLAVQKSGGANKIQEVTQSSLNAAIEQVRSANPESYKRLSDKGLINVHSLGKRIETQAQAIVDAVPTITDMQSPSVDAFVRQAINR